MKMMVMLTWHFVCCTVLPRFPPVFYRGAQCWPEAISYYFVVVHSSAPEEFPRTFSLCAMLARNHFPALCRFAKFGPDTIYPYFVGFQSSNPKSVPRTLSFCTVPPRFPPPFVVLDNSAMIPPSVEVSRKYTTRSLRRKSVLQ
jgi:hypothetical protein